MSDHDHDHDHAPITNGDEPPAAARARALEELLVEKGVISREDVRRNVAKPNEADNSRSMDDELDAFKTQVNLVSPAASLAAHRIRPQRDPDHRCRPCGDLRAAHTPRPAPCAAA